MDLEIPCMFTLLVVERGTVTLHVHLSILLAVEGMHAPSICTYCWWWKEILYYLHVHTAGDGKGYTVHVHTAGSETGYTLYIHTADGGK
jgi:hypothetical protein